MFRKTAACFAVAMLALLVGCAQEASAPPRTERATKTFEPAFDGALLPPADMSGDGPGTLVEAKPFGFSTVFDEANANAVEMTYRSTSGLDGRPTEVSGVVVAPPGNPPRGGWPIVAVGHIFTGVISPCAPSLAAEVGGYASTLAVFLQNGYAVVMSDYEGLGTDEGLQHLPLQAETLANNLIDSVRAARRIIPTASTQWAAYGAGQGGQAAWAAADRASSYGQGLDMVGAVALSPWVGMSRMVDDAMQDVLPREQYFLYVSLVESLGNSPAQLDPDDYLSPRTSELVGVRTKCAPLDPVSLVEAVKGLEPSDIRPRDEAAASRLREEIAGASAPLSPSGPVPPVLVAYGTEDLTVREQWIFDAVKTACQRGDPIEVNRRIGDPNANNGLVTQMALSWLQQRFDGQKLGDDCVGVA